MNAVKKMLLLGFLAFGVLQVNAQGLTDAEESTGYSTLGRHSISFHYGIPSVQKMVANTVNNIVDFQFRETGPFHVKYQYRAGRVFEWGLMLNYQESSFNWTDSLESNRVDAQIGADVSSFNAIARMNLHFLKSGMHNFYLGMGLGFSYWKVNPIGGIVIDDEVNLAIPNFLSLKGVLPAGEFVLGYRGFLNKQVGISAELGLTKSIFQAGLTYRFN
ncbi:MAG: hypothetical protein EP332_01885 [Bacteroidetes bacterium]|nr:MAG: hypothetical protein EP332_01885 [Bacteroidota bacterium]